MDMKVNYLCVEASGMGLKINEKKTKEMRINARNNLALQLYKEDIERVTVLLPWTLQPYCHVCLAVRL